MMKTIYKGIEPGTEIVDMNGSKVGTVHEVILNDAAQLQMLTVQKGLIFKTDIGVPATAIDRVEGGMVYLCVEKSTLTELLKPDAAKEPVTSTDRTREDGVDDGDMMPRGVLDRQPNMTSVPPPPMHDVGTGDRTHDMGIGTAGQPGPSTGNPVMRGDSAGMVDRTQSQEPSSKERT
ncbi:MAG TPA: PRC-barrel domain-containing protein [Chloroflexia bacterium]|nr:PRC-barrel domain-containing protein [Chloroflexia bacterium]